jgi:hypothetical protein
MAAPAQTGNGFFQRSLFIYVAIRAVVVSERTVERNGVVQLGVLDRRGSLGLWRLARSRNSFEEEGQYLVACLD